MQIDVRQLTGQYSDDLKMCVVERSAQIDRNFRRMGTIKEKKKEG